MFEMYVNKLENLFSRSRRRKTHSKYSSKFGDAYQKAKSNNQEFYTYSKYQAWNFENLFTLRDTVEASLCASNIFQPYGLSSRMWLEGNFENIQVCREISLEPAVADRVKMNFWFTERFFRRRRRRRSKTRRYKLVHCALINNSVNSI